MDDRQDFRNSLDIEELAAALHHSYLDAGEQSQVAARMDDQAHPAWSIHPELRRRYDELSDDAKAANRAAARRIPGHLALIEFTIERQTDRDDEAWQRLLRAAIERNIERLAQAEHVGWCADRTASGWVYGQRRDNQLKHHPSLVPWLQLTPQDQAKDREVIRAIPALLELAKYKAVRSDGL